MSSHSFRMSLVSLIDHAGLSTAVGADHLGDTDISMIPAVISKELTMADQDRFPWRPRPVRHHHTACQDAIPPCADVRGL